MRRGRGSRCSGARSNSRRPGSAFRGGGKCKPVRKRFVPPSSAPGVRSNVGGARWGAGDRGGAGPRGLAREGKLPLGPQGKGAAATSGSFLFTHFGYSGPAALDLSRHWHRAQGERAVSAGFLPGETIESLRDAWLAAARESHLGVRKHLGVRLPDRLVVALCEESDVAPATALTQVARARRDTLLG